MGTARAGVSAQDLLFCTPAGIGIAGRFARDPADKQIRVMTIAPGIFSTPRRRQCNAERRVDSFTRQVYAFCNLDKRA
jgi:NAD(P)-dependent dehydrogenase (short-subunit alcohol dehydrogenase family)